MRDIVQSNELSDLPDEIILKNILPHLSPRQLVNFSATCRRFREISLDFSLPHRFFCPSKTPTIVLQKNIELINSITERGDYIFCFSHRNIHIYNKKNSEYREIYYDKESSLFSKYQIVALGDFRQFPFGGIEASQLWFIVSCYNFGIKKYLEMLIWNGTLLWEAQTYGDINPPRDTSTFAMTTDHRFYGKSSGEIEIELIDRKLKLIKPIGNLKNHKKPILAMTTADKKLYSLCEDKLIVWDIESQALEKIIHNTSEFIGQVCLDVIGNKILICDKMLAYIGAIEVIDFMKEVTVLKLEAPKGWRACHLREEELLVVTELPNCLVSIRLDQFSRLIKNDKSTMEQSLSPEF